MARYVVTVSTPRTPEAAFAFMAVTYDAELKLNGVLRCADFVLKPLFKRIGDRAAKGLTTALGGVVVSS